MAFQRGINFTAERGAFYGSEECRRQLSKLPGYGIDSIAVVPYGFVRQGTPLVRLPGAGSWERDEGVVAVAQHARSLGLRVLLKPQIWVGGGGFPGSLDFAGPSRRAFFDSYAMFVDHYARLAARCEAETFCVGTEFVRLSGETAEWRELIARARSQFRGKLTYASTQGPEFETLAFWDALDFIGLNSYYPLPDSLDASSVAARVEAVALRHRKPLLLTEAGFASLQAPHRQPWDETPRPLSMTDQARCYEAIFRAFYNKSWCSGMYWWKVGTNGYGGEADGSHTPWGKPAMDVLRRWYRGGLRR